MRHVLSHAGLRRAQEPEDAETPNTFAIPAGFSSATSSLSITVGLAGLMVCATAAMGGYVATTLLRPHAEPADSAALVAVAPAPDDVASATADPPAPPSDPAAAGAEAPVPAAAPPVPMRETAPGAFSTLWPGLATVPASQATPHEAGVAAPAADPGYAGIWVPHQMACSPQASRKGFLPAVIKSDGAWAGETSCSFTNVKREANSWTVSAACADTRSSWKTTVKLTVTRDRLIWKSPRGTQIYVRCERSAFQVARAASDRLQ